jgi:sialic acid synthase SpsE
MRRSLVAKRLIKAGELITEAMLACKRPAVGLSPSFAAEVVGRKAAVDIPPDAFITWKDLA